MRKLPLLLLFALPITVMAEPYKIVIVTDEEASARAQEFKDYLLKKPPYDKMKAEDLEIKIVKQTKEEMKCSNTNPKSPRIIGCDTSKLNKIKSKEEAHLAMAFTSAVEGGAGGGIPIASKNYPIQTMLHEMLHTYGMADEYCYSESEAEVYCSPPRVQGNMAHFNEEPPYDSDSKARDKHASEVPWMRSIDVKHLITQGTALGSTTPEKIVKGKQELGLYRGGTCDKAKVAAGKKPIQSWRPYPDSIMKGYNDDTIYPMYEKIIIQNIEAKIGRKLKLQTVSEAPCPPEGSALVEGLEEFESIVNSVRN